MRSGRLDGPQRDPGRCDVRMLPSRRKERDDFAQYGRGRSLLILEDACRTMQAGQFFDPFPQRPNDLVVLASIFAGRIGSVRQRGHGLKNSM